MATETKTPESGADTTATIDTSTAGATVTSGTESVLVAPAPLAADVEINEERETLGVAAALRAEVAETTEYNAVKEVELTGIRKFLAARFDKRYMNFVVDYGIRYPLNLVGKFAHPSFDQFMHTKNWEAEGHTLEDRNLVHHLIDLGTQKTIYDSGKEKGKYRKGNFIPRDDNTKPISDSNKPVNALTLLDRFDNARDISHAPEILAFSQALALATQEIESTALDLEKIAPNMQLITSARKFSKSMDNLALSAAIGANANIAGFIEDEVQEGLENLGKIIESNKENASPEAASLYQTYQNNVGIIQGEIAELLKEETPNLLKVRKSVKELESLSENFANDIEEQIINPLNKSCTDILQKHQSLVNTSSQKAEKSFKEISNITVDIKNFATRLENNVKAILGIPDSGEEAGSELEKWGANKTVLAVKAFKEFAEAHTGTEASVHTELAKSEKDLETVFSRSIDPMSGTPIQRLEQTLKALKKTSNEVSKLNTNPISNETITSESVKRKIRNALEVAEKATYVPKQINPFKYIMDAAGPLRRLSLEQGQDALITRRTSFRDIIKGRVTLGNWMKDNIWNSYANPFRKENLRGKPNPMRNLEKSYGFVEQQTKRDNANFKQALVTWVMAEAERIYRENPADFNKGMERFSWLYGREGARELGITQEIANAFVEAGKKYEEAIKAGTSTKDLWITPEIAAKENHRFQRQKDRPNDVRNYMAKKYDFESGIRYRGDIFSEFGDSGRTEGPGAYKYLFNQFILNQFFYPVTKPFSMVGDWSRVILPVKDSETTRATIRKVGAGIIGTGVFITASPLGLQVDDLQEKVLKDVMGNWSPITVMNWATGTPQENSGKLRDFYWDAPTKIPRVIAWAAGKDVQKLSETYSYGATVVRTPVEVAGKGIQYALPSSWLITVVEKGIGSLTGLSGGGSESKNNSNTNSNSNSNTNANTAKVDANKVKELQDEAKKVLEQIEKKSEANKTENTQANVQATSPATNTTTEGTSATTPTPEQKQKTPAECLKEINEMLKRGGGGKAPEGCGIVSTIQSDKILKDKSGNQIAALFQNVGGKNGNNVMIVLRRNFGDAGADPDSDGAPDLHEEHTMDLNNNGLA